MQQAWSGRCRFVRNRPMNRRSNYDKFPAVRVPVGRECVWQGWREILSRMAGEISRGAQRIAVEIYPGVFEEEVLAAFVQALHPAHVFRTSKCWKTPTAIDALVQRDLTDDPVFGRLSQLTIQDFADAQTTSHLRALRREARGLVLTVGTGSALLEPEPDVMILADLARWEIQKRQRAKQIGNFPACAVDQSAAAKYKRAYFVDW